MSEELLKTYSLTKKFKGYSAVSEVNLEINRGDIYGFIGRNGAGKTTFLRMIGGLSFPTSGRIEIFGKDCAKCPQLFSRLGVLIESPGLIGNMTAYENIKTKCLAYGINDRAYIEELLDNVGLIDTGTQKSKNFSLGMKQRLGIALALVGNPDILVLDEPINGLDPQGIAEVRDTIVKLNKEKNLTIIISSHILEELSKIASKYAIIHNGVLIKKITKEELLEQSMEQIEIETSQIKEASTLLEEKLNIHKYKVVSPQMIHILERIDEPGIVNMTLASNGIYITSLKVCSDDLETYFINLTGGASDVKYN